MNKGKKLYHKPSSDNFFESNSEEEDKDSFFDSEDDDFSDHFVSIFMDDDFGFSNIHQIHNRLFGKSDRIFELGDGYEDNRREKGQKRKKKDFADFLSLKNDTPGTIISKSICTRIDYSDGTPHTECYQSQSINQIKNGHKISEKQEAYKNTRTGVEKAAHQRILDDKGVRKIRQRNVNTNTQEEHNIFKGLKEEELDDFNQDYNNFRNKKGLKKNYKYLNGFDNNEKENYSRKENNPKMIYPQLEDGNNKENPIKKQSKRRYYQNKRRE
jgi:hypothetical protein